MNYGIQWDQIGDREWEVGVSHGVLYPLKNGVYQDGVAWNGLSGVDENPEGGDINNIWADNIKYATFQTAENHKGTVKAYMFPDEFYACNGWTSPEGMIGLVYAGQRRIPFGFCYRTEVGTDTDEAKGYKLHIVYNCRVQPSSRSHNTKNENVEPEEMSWDYSSTPVPVVGVEGVEQTSVVEVKSVDFTKAQMEALESVLYGTPAIPAVEADVEHNIAAQDAVDAVPARLPSPGEIYTILQGAAASNNG
jgi:hypothetical protein